MSRAVEAIPNWVNDHASTVLGPQRHDPRPQSCDCGPVSPHRCVLAEYSPAAARRQHRQTGTWWRYRSLAGIHEQGPGSRRNRRLGSSSSSHVKAATRTARARWFPSDAGGSPSLAAVRQALLTSSEHRRAAGPWSASTQRAVVAEPSEQARFHTTDLDVDVPRRLRTLPLPCWMLRDPPAPGSRDPLPSRVKVYRAVGMRGPSAGTDCTAEQLRSLGGSARGRSNGTVHGPETVGGSFPFTMVLPSSAPGPYAPRGGLSRAPTFSQKPSGKTEPPTAPHCGRFSCVALSAGMAVPDK